MKTKQQLKYVHFSIENRSTLIEIEQVTDYDGQSIEIPVTPHLVSFKQGHQDAKSPMAHYNFVPDYVHILPDWQDRAMTKDQRKAYESAYRKHYSYFEGIVPSDREPGNHDDDVYLY